MSRRDQLRLYLKRLESRLRLLAWSRGIALVAVLALLVTVGLAVVTNTFAFSALSLHTARMALFLILGAAAAFALLVPLLRLNARKAARRAETRCSEFGQRLLTLADESDEPARNPFFELLAADTLPVTGEAPPGRVVSARWIVAAAALAVVAVMTLAWLASARPGYLGYGAGLLWAGPPPEGSPGFYRLLVRPGNRTLRRGAEQLITAETVGMQPKQVRLFARFASASKWEEAAMMPQAGDSGYSFLFPSVVEDLEYRVEAGALRSETYTLRVKDLPAVKQVRVDYEYPAWSRLKPARDQQGGDVRAVQGAAAKVRVETDRPLRNGYLVFDDGRRTPLVEAASPTWTYAQLAVEKEGSYYLAALDDGELIRLSEDFFVEPLLNQEPLLRITRPGRDSKVSPIEEVTIAVTAQDDFGLHDLKLHYSVNGGEERTAGLLSRQGAREVEGGTTLYLEEHNLVPGDVVSYYATARDAITSTRTDIYFLEAQPFEREYSQSQQSGGGGGGGEDSRISQRQKEIIAATWNELNARSKAQDTARFLAEVQGALRDQAKSLAERMKRRRLAGTNEEFRRFVEEMEKAAEAMSGAAEELKRVQWKSALQPEQKALQHLLRAEAVFRQIQVAFGRGGGGGGGGGGRDLESLFDLELDTEKNQYETGQQAAENQRSREVDETLRKLQELARRQQELANQRRQPGQVSQQRWQQETLRREAEQLRRQLEQMVRGNSASSNQTTSASPSSAAGSGQSAADRTRPMLRSQPDPRLRQALERLSRATEDMRRATSGQPALPNSSGDARRAAERLREAQEALQGMRQQESSERLANLSGRAGQLAGRQEDFAKRLREAFGQDEGQPEKSPGQLRAEGQEFAREKERILEEYQRLERDMQGAVREMEGGKRGAGSKLREALGQAQQDELALRMKYSAEYLRRGFGNHVWMREAPVTRGLQQLSERLRQAQSAQDEQQQGEGALAQALSEVEQLRRQLQEMAQRSRAARGANQGQSGTGTAPGRAGAPQGSDQSGAGAPGGGREGRPGWEGRQGGSAREATEFGAMNRGDYQPQPPGAAPAPLSPEEAARIYGQGLRDLSQMRRELREDAELAGDVQALIREMQRLDPSRFPGNPALLGQLESRVLTALEQLELQLRRKAGEAQEGNVRTGASDPVPAGYAGAVAEYFRKLSKSR